MITSDILKSICYYEEQVLIGNTSTVSYITMEQDSDRKILQKMRNVKINAILDEVLDEDTHIGYNSENAYIGYNSEYPTIYPVLKSMIMTGTVYQYLDNDIIFDEVIKHIIKLVTNNTSTSLYDINLSNEIHNDRIAIIKNINRISNHLYNSSRMGNVGFIIIHPMDIYYIDEIYLNSIKIIKSNKVTKGKIILGVNPSNHMGEGIYVIKSENSLFIKETKNWDKSYAWFSIN